METLSTTELLENAGGDKEVATIAALVQIADVLMEIEKRLREIGGVLEKDYPPISK